MQDELTIKKIRAINIAMNTIHCQSLRTPDGELSNEYIRKVTPLWNKLFLNRWHMASTNGRTTIALIQAIEIRGQYCYATVSKHIGIDRLQLEYGNSPTRCTFDLEREMAKPTVAEAEKVKTTIDEAFYTPMTAPTIQDNNLMFLTAQNKFAAIDPTTYMGFLTKTKQDIHGRMGILTTTTQQRIQFLDLANMKKTTVEEYMTWIKHTRQLIIDNINKQQ